MSDAFSGAASAQRINQSMCEDPLLLHRVDASKLESPIHVQHGRVEERVDYDDLGTPMTRTEIAGCLLAFVASWAVVGVLFYGAVKLAEAMR